MWKQEVAIAKPFKNKLNYKATKTLPESQLGLKPFEIDNTQNQINNFLNPVRGVAYFPDGIQKLHITIEHAP